MKQRTMRDRLHRRNGGKPDPVAARRAFEAALDYKRRHGTLFDGLTAAQILARIKKTRYELFEERFAPHRSR